MSQVEVLLIIYMGEKYRVSGADDEDQPRITTSYYIFATRPELWSILSTALDNVRLTCTMNDIKPVMEASDHIAKD